MNGQYDVRAGELLAWSAETGIPLPATVEEILAIEDSGGVVDLETGAVWRNVTATPTLLGEVTLIVIEAEEVKHDR